MRTNLLNEKKKGFLLLIAMIISGILLTVGYSILNVTIKQIELAASGRESQVAFFAADAGMECALLWDYLHPERDSDYGSYFASSSPEFGSPRPYSGAGVECNQQDIVTLAGEPVIEDQFDAVTEFTLSLAPDPFSGGAGKYPCAFIQVIKSGTDVDSDENFNIEPSANGKDEVYTEVAVRGYNICEVGNPRRVERGIRKDYIVSSD